MKVNIFKNIYSAFGVTLALLLGRRVGMRLLVAITCFSACKTNTTENTSTETKATVNVHVPTFNPDSAYQFVADQVAFGPRVPSTEAHKKCAQYFVNKLKSYGCTVIEQNFEAKTFDGKTHACKNIIASINPEATKRILLTAHWDSRPFADQDAKDKNKAIDGANDGGSGVAVLLEIARAIHADTAKAKVGIDILLLDAEDYGQPEGDTHPEMKDSWCLGSQYWAANKHVPNYQAYFGILLDMVGAKDAKFALEGTSKMMAGEVQKKVWAIAKGIGYGNTFIYQDVDPITDDHVYINRIAQIPTIDIIEYEPSDGSFFSKTWHTHNDNLENIDKNTLQAVGRTVLCAVYAE